MTTSNNSDWSARTEPPFCCRDPGTKLHRPPKIQNKLIITSIKYLFAVTMVIYILVREEIIPPDWAR